MSVDDERKIVRVVLSKEDRDNIEEIARAYSLHGSRTTSAVIGIALQFLVDNLHRQHEQARENVSDNKDAMKVINDKFDNLFASLDRAFKDIESKVKSK